MTYFRLKQDIVYEIKNEEIKPDGTGCEFAETMFKQPLGLAYFIH